jgi:hypothetical protein
MSDSVLRCTTLYNSTVVVGARPLPNKASKLQLYLLASCTVVQRLAFSQGIGAGEAVLVLQNTSNEVLHPLKYEQVVVQR